MNRISVTKHAMRLALGLAALALAASPSSAQTTVDLCATTGAVTMPGGAVITIWGYADITGGGDCSTAVATLPGPEIRVLAADGPLTINLTNNLSEDVSFFVPGLMGTATGGNVGTFTNDAAASGGTASYEFDLTDRSGTFLYYSATDRIRTQVPMGLYGALVVDDSAGMAYADVAYDSDQVLVFSEIDPALNADPAGMDGAKVINWVPQYFLINGQAYDEGSPPAAMAITVGDNVLLRFVNAGLDSLMPTLGGGLYMNLKAEDGNRYPHPIQQYGLELEAGKTIDAMVQVTSAGSYALYDRSDHVTNGAASKGGMYAFFDAAAGTGLLQLSAATYSVGEAGPMVTITVDRVGGSAGDVSVDYATADGSATDTFDYTGASGTLSWLNGDAVSQSFDVAIIDDATYEGDEDFSVALSNAIGANIGSPSSAVVTIVENDPGPGVLQFSAATYSAAENGGTLTVTVDRVGGSAGPASVDYSTAAGTATDGSDYTGVAGTLNWADGVATSQDINITILDDTTYEGDENFSVDLSNAIGAPLGTPASAVATILEDDPAPNVAPIANDDTTEIQRGTVLVNYDIVANDEDPDTTKGPGDPANLGIDPTSVDITTGTTTQRGGTVVNNGDGTITYTPKNTAWTGTDTFQYTVNDNDGATSNVATVRINVVK